MISGKTTTGFEYEIAPDALNNYELLENVSEMESNPLVIAEIVKQLLGKEQTKKLKEHVRNENGIVPMEKMTDEIVDIFKKSGKETKNS